MLIILLIIILIACWNYDIYADLRKRFKGYKNNITRAYERKKNFIIYGPSYSGKTTFIKDFCNLYRTVNVFWIDKSEWKGCNVYGSNDLDLLDHISNYAYSFIIFDDMRDNNGLPMID